jgi:hypothetical protein
MPSVTRLASQKVLVILSVVRRSLRRTESKDLWFKPLLILGGILQCLFAFGKG